MASNWAIAIGVNEYQFLPSLKYAVSDAEAMRDWFSKEAGFEKVYLFTDNSPPIEDGKSPFASQPNRDNLRRFLRTRFKTDFLKAGDNLWFYFSGHGIRHKGRDYLIPSGADPHPDEIEHSAISLSYVTERLRRCGADNVVLVLDACRDELGDKGFGVGDDTQQGVITIASCRPEKKSYEIPELRMGSFTYCLLQGLRIQGEGNCATLERLDNYLRSQVPELNRTYGKPRQTPYAIAEPASKYHLLLLPEYIQPTLKDISILREEAYEAQIEGDLELAEMLWRRLVKFDQEKALKALQRIWLKQYSSDATVPPEPDLPEDESDNKSTSEVKPAKPEPSFSFEVITVNSEGEEIKRENKTATYFVEQLSDDVTLEMVKIPGGTFFMGTDGAEVARLNKKYDTNWFDNEKPQHQVTVPSFFMGKFQVTQAQWQAVMGSNPAFFKNNLLNPVEQVSWDDAQEFCQKLSEKTRNKYRLPSEAEWEYACRAGTNTPFYFGETITTDLANYSGNSTYADEPKGISRQKTTPVGSFLSNTFGLYDMHGNVWEWCGDDWHDDYKDAPSDGSAWLSGDSSLTVIRGGSWNYNPFECRSAYRFRFVRDLRFYVIGFRVVCASASTL